MQRVCLNILLACWLLGHLAVAQTPKSYKHRSDKRTLDDKSKPVLMPFNRLIASAGTVLTYGDPRLENHTLDAALLPDGRFVVFEDRYGIAVVNRATQQISRRWGFRELPDKAMQSLMSTFSGIKAFRHQTQTYIVWGVGGKGETSGIVLALWENDNITSAKLLTFPKKAPAPMALPNEIAVQQTPTDTYLYVVLNGNNQLAKVRVSDLSTLWTVDTGVAPFGVQLVQNKVFVSNWGGPRPGGMRPSGPRPSETAPKTPTTETAGVPWGDAYVEPRTGAINQGSVSVFDANTGDGLGEITVGLHPNAMVASPDQRSLYVSNGNSDNVSVIDVSTRKVVQTIPVGLLQTDSTWVGSTPNGLAIDRSGQRLYVSNGMDEAVAVVALGNRPSVQGYIPTEAYPSGLLWVNDTLYVANLEAKGARVRNQTPALKKRFPKLADDDDDEAPLFAGAFNSHEQLASLSIIPVPNAAQLATFTKQVRENNLSFRKQLSHLLPRRNVRPRPVPERTGEPSVFKHVLYIIKENRTYDQVYGDLKQGRGMASLCIFGDSITPNQHRLALEYSLLDNYHVSGKSSAEGHQWTDAGMVSDYIEKNVRAWFRSYPHRQYDAMVYTPNGFIWNHALDRGKSVRIYGEACFTEFDENLKWADIWGKYQRKEPFEFRNTSTISRVRPILSQTFPGYDDPRINDQLRADAFIRELHRYEQLPGDSLPELMVIALPNDHTAGTSPGYPTPRAMVADNDLALGRMIDALTKSRFWDSTVVFVTEDDSQNGWDHLSAYRTGALVISPYSRLGKTVTTQYNQISMLRTIELILGLPPMHALDATALPMFDCFTDKKSSVPYTYRPNRVPLDEMNKPLGLLRGKALHYARESLENLKEGVDTGDDEVMNRILWFYAKGNAPYPAKPKAR